MSEEISSEEIAALLARGSEEMDEIDFIQPKKIVGKLISVVILDKIKAEIHATAELHEDGDYYLRDEWIDEIFDKYMVESEEQA